MLYFSKFLVAKNSMNNREGKYYDFLSKSFCLTITKKFVGNTSVLCFRKFPVAKKFLDKKGGGWSIKILRRNFFVSRCRKISWVNPLVCH